MTLSKTGERFARCIAAILMAAVMTLASFGNAMATGACDGGMMPSADAHAHHVHHPMAMTDTGHTTIEHDTADHHIGSHMPSCCSSGCLACVPAILLVDVGLSPQPVSFAFEMAADTIASGRSLSPLLGPPRSRI